MSVLFPPFFPKWNALGNIFKGHTITKCHARESRTFRNITSSNHEDSAPLHLQGSHNSDNRSNVRSEQDLTETVNRNISRQELGVVIRNNNVLEEHPTTKAHRSVGAPLLPEPQMPRMCGECGHRYTRKETVGRGGHDLAGQPVPRTWELLWLAACPAGPNPAGETFWSDCCELYKSNSDLLLLVESATKNTRAENTYIPTKRKPWLVCFLLSTLSHISNFLNFNFGISISFLKSFSSITCEASSQTFFF